MKLISALIACVLLIGCDVTSSGGRDASEQVVSCKSVTVISSGSDLDGVHCSGDSTWYSYRYVEKRYEYKIQYASSQGCLPKGIEIWSDYDLCETITIENDTISRIK